MRLEIHSTPRASTNPLPSSLRRKLYVALGALSVAFGTVGLFVPGLPTTVFLIVASWFFVRSSPALHDRLVSHPRLGPPLRRFLEGRAMPRRAKVAAIASMWIGIAFSVVMLNGTLGGNGGQAYPILASVMAAMGATGTAVLLFCVRTVSASTPPVEAEFDSMTERPGGATV